MLLDEGAKDATAAFEDVGHTDDARDLLVKYYIGEVDPNVSVFSGRDTEQNRDLTWFILYSLSLSRLRDLLKLFLMHPRESK